MNWWINIGETLIWRWRERSEIKEITEEKDREIDRLKKKLHAALNEKKSGGNSSSSEKHTIKVGRESKELDEERQMTKANVEAEDNFS